MLIMWARSTWHTLHVHAAVQPTASMTSSAGAPDCVLPSSLQQQQGGVVLQGNFNPMQEPSGIYNPMQADTEDDAQSRYQGLLSLMPAQPHAEPVSPAQVWAGCMLLRATTCTTHTCKASMPLAQHPCSCSLQSATARLHALLLHAVVSCTRSQERP